jgi:Polyketide cyclase / dehydrase and lipid transport
MARVTASASSQIDAPPERVLAFLREYRSNRPKILTDNFSAYRVEVGGEGAGTVLAYHFAAGRRERDYRLRVDEPDGRLRERDELSSFVSTWDVAPTPGGSSVTIEGSWDGATGIAGTFEGFFAPLGLKRIYGQMLSRLSTALAA